MARHGVLVEMAEVAAASKQDWRPNQEHGGKDPEMTATSGKLMVQLREEPNLFSTARYQTEAPEPNGLHALRRPKLNETKNVQRIGAGWTISHDGSKVKISRRGGPLPQWKAENSGKMCRKLPAMLMVLTIQ